MYVVNKTEIILFFVNACVFHILYKMTLYFKLYCKLFPFDDSVRYKLDLKMSSKSELLKFDITTT